MKEKTQHSSVPFKARFSPMKLCFTELAIQDGESPLARSG